MDLATMERQATLLGKPLSRELPKSVVEALAYSGLMRFLGLPQPENYDAHSNFAYSTILTAPSPATSGTSLVVQSGDGAKFPTVPFNVTIWPAGVQPLTTNAEIARVTNVSTDTFTLTRTQESTSARTVVVGDQIAATITKKTITDIEVAIPLMLQPLDIPPTGAISQTMSRFSITGLASLVTGQLRLFAIYLPTATTITSITFVSGTTALAQGTSPHAWFALYDSSLALLRQSTDDTNPVWAASTAKTYNLSSTFLTTYTGLHYIGVMVVCGAGGTMPTMQAASNNSATITGIAPILAGISSTGQTTTAPNPAAALTASGAPMYGYVS